MRTVALALFVLALAAYFGSYAVLVRPGLYHSYRYAGEVEERYPRLEKVGGRATRVGGWVYAPANWLDRKVRPGAWAPPACVW